MQGSRADQAAASVLLELLETIEATIPGALEGSDSDQLHDLRVAVRSTRAVVRGLGGVFEPESVSRFSADFKWLQQLTNPTRDLDVLLMVLDDAGDEGPGDLAPVRRSVAKRRTAERRTLRRGLTSARARNLLADWRTFLDILPQLETEDRPDADRPLKKVAGARVAKDYRKLVRHGRAAQAEPSAEAFHALRKRGKDLRYFLEFFADLYPKRPVKTLLSELKSLHAVLGGFHDRAVQRQILNQIAEDLSAAGSSAEPLLAIGGLMQQMLAAQAGAEAKFDKRFAEFSSKKQRALVKSIFA